MTKDTAEWLIETLETEACDIQHSIEDNGDNPVGADFERDQMRHCLTALNYAQNLAAKLAGNPTLELMEIEA